MIVDRAAAARARGRRSAGTAPRRSHDAAHAYVYVQRTADGRIAIGGRGAPVPLRARARPLRRGRGLGRRGLERRAARAVPGRRRRADRARAGRACSARRATGVPRSAPTRATGLAWAGGWVGVGVAAANLGGRILRRPRPRRALRPRDAAVRRPRLASRLGAGAAPLPRRDGHVRACTARPTSARRTTGRPSRLAGIANGSPAASTEYRPRVHARRALRVQPRAVTCPVARSAHLPRVKLWGSDPRTAQFRGRPRHGRRTLPRGSVSPPAVCTLHISAGPFGRADPWRRRPPIAYDHLRP